MAGIRCVGEFPVDQAVTAFPKAAVPRLVLLLPNSMHNVA